uniref:RNA polymerase n=1 Tax=Tephrocybe rancida TaxID=117070 RepID=A0A386TY72_9AGAR|nr:RNA polymerase [Tephrocybe rancida]YP_009517279.1 RNA polymerase [Tephrocybe rancida]AYE93176.1 RNA polymerase [Tephrocybe rancida]AYE93177.1 RNA polymerase [Tephrocybe rancida]
MKKWNNLPYKLNNKQLFTKRLLKYYINKFWEDIINKTDIAESHILLIFRIQFDNGDSDYRTLGDMQTLSKSEKDKDFYINYLLSIMELKSDTYNTLPVLSIVFSYGFRDGLSTPFRGPSCPLTPKARSKYQTYYNNKLPVAFNPLDYGELMIKNNNVIWVRINDKVCTCTEQISAEACRRTGAEGIKEKYNTVKYFKNNKEIYTWRDTYVNENTFKRSLGKSVYTYENNELVLLEVIKKTGYIKPILSDQELDQKFITMDLETYQAPPLPSAEGDLNKGREDGAEVSGRKD